MRSSVKNIPLSIFLLSVQRCFQFIPCHSHNTQTAQRETRLLWQSSERIDSLIVVSFAQQHGSIVVCPLVEHRKPIAIETFSPACFNVVERV